MKIANVPHITPQAVMDNFEGVTVPAIKQWQFVRHPEGLRKDELIGDLLLKLAESVSHVSDVMVRVINDMLKRGSCNYRYLWW